jgi:DNA (cytosine-5)-methyltransferase 1
MKIGSLCSGYGGLDMAVEAFYDANTAWMCDIDKYASIVIKERWGLPNLGDMKQVDWSNVEPVDILTAGYPCQPFSTAGQRKGSEDERHLWPYIKEIISQLQPKRVILENVRGHLTLGFKEVLADLTEIGYDAKWAIVRASDVGAPHQRARLFLIAYPNGKGFQRTGDKVDDITDGITADSNSQTSEQLRRTDRTISSERSKVINGTNREKRWSGFEITKREIPPTLVGDKLNPQFVEYMMGLPKGWVTDLDISRSQQLKLLGNGVVPQQAYYAINQLERL